MISHKHKCIYVHVPRTGGTSVEKFFKDGTRRGHHLLHSYEEYLGIGKYRQYYKFAFVRNPWDKMVSEYFWFRNSVHLYPDSEVKRFFRRFSSCFSEFVKLFFETDIGDGTHRMCQLDFLNPISDLDFSGRFERYEEDFVRMCSYLGISNEKSIHENNVSHRLYQEYYDDETREIVAEKYAKDIEHFGYKFGED